MNILIALLIALSVTLQGASSWEFCNPQWNDCQPIEWQGIEEAPHRDIYREIPNVKRWWDIGADAAWFGKLTQDGEQRGWVFYSWDEQEIYVFLFETLVTGEDGNVHPTLGAWAIPIEIWQDGVGDD